MNLGLAIILCTIIIGLLVAYERSKSSRHTTEAKEHFWSLESKANSTRKKDISGLNYIQIPLESLPFITTDNDDINQCQDSIKKMADRKILNLTGITNTQLKLSYGVANLETLSQYDENFTALASLLAKWGRYLNEAGYENEAIKVLEFGIDCNTDISQNYYLLAEIYKKHGDTDKLNWLIQKASDIPTFMKDTIINNLQQIYDRAD